VWSFTGHGPGDQTTCPQQRRRYRPRQTLIDKIIGMHQTCRHPGCRRRAQRCDLDHLIPYTGPGTGGGTTCACNLVPLCRFHHRLKTHAGWKARFTTRNEPYPAGTIEWTSPHRQRHLVPPPTFPGSNDWTTPALIPADGSDGANTTDDPFHPDDATREERQALRLQVWSHHLAKINKRLPSASPPPPRAYKDPDF
jgi:hypothetical protein